MYTLHAPTTPCEDTKNLCTLCLTLIFRLFVFQMSGRYHEHSGHRGRRGGQWFPSFFEVWLRRGVHATIPLSLPAYDKEVHSDNDLIHEAKNHLEGAEGSPQVQPSEGNLPAFSLPSHALSFMGAGISASDTAPLTSSHRYTCEDWVLRISIGKLKPIAREYKLGEIAHWPSPNERPHLPSISYMAFSEAILKAGVSLPLHSFIGEVLRFFDVVPFQLNPNSYSIMVTFYIAFTEACRFKPSIGHFAYVFGIKAVTKYAGFWYTISHGDAARIAGILSNMDQWKNDFFFYPSAHFGEFRMERKW